MSKETKKDVTDKKNSPLTEERTTAVVGAGSVKDSVFSSSALRTGIGLGLVLLIIVGLITYGFNRQNQPKCSKELLNEAQIALDPAHQRDLPPVAKKVLAIKDYKKDVNCNYVVTAYYIQINDVQNSQSSLRTLQKTYDPKKGYSPDLGYFYVQSLKNLQLQVDALVKTHTGFNAEPFGSKVSLPAGTIKK